jgi:hypothetical protein
MRRGDDWAAGPWLSVDEQNVCGLSIAAVSAEPAEAAARFRAQGMLRVNGVVPACGSHFGPLSQCHAVVCDAPSFASRLPRGWSLAASLGACLPACLTDRLAGCMADTHAQQRHLRPVADAF